MTEKNNFKMPFLMDVERAAKIIVDGIERRARIVEFPWPMSMAVRLSRLLPEWLMDRAMSGYRR